MQESDPKIYYFDVSMVVVISKDKKFKSDVFKPIKSLNRNRFHKGFNVATIVDSLRQIFFAKHMDNLFLELVGSTNN